MSLEAVVSLIGVVAAIGIFCAEQYISRGERESRQALEIARLAVQKAEEALRIAKGIS